MEDYKKDFEEKVEVKHEPKAEPKKKSVDVEAFKARKLKSINMMKNKVKAKFNANLVLKNK